MDGRSGALNPAELQTAVARYDRSRVADALRPLYGLSNARGAFALVWCWLWIAVALASAIGLDHWAAYVAAFVVISGRQVALFFLVHEAAHHRLFSDRVWSDRVTNLFAGFAVGVHVDSYRRHHLQHHRHLNTQSDPDWALHQNEFWRWPRAPRSAAVSFAKSIVGLHAKKWLGVLSLSPFARFRSMTRSERVLFCVFVASLASVLTVTNGWLLFACLWLLPMFTFGFWLHHLRTIAEHLALENSHELNETRTVVSSPIERFLVAPMGVNFHLEHHLFPGIPAYHLAAAHRALMRDEQFRAHAHITRSYMSLLGEITRVAYGGRSPEA